MGIQGTGGVRCQPPLASSLIASTRARSCPGACPSPTTHPTMSPMAQDPDSLCCHFIKGHPLNGAHVLQFLHGLPHGLLQRHGGLQASQCAKHWAVSPQGQSWYSPAPNCPTPPSSKASMGPTPAKPRLKRGRRGCLESKGKPSWCLVPPPPTHQRMLVHSLAIAGTLWLGAGCHLI